MLNNTPFNLKLKQGLEADLPDVGLVEIGEPHFCTDTGNIFVSDGTNWKQFYPDTDLRYLKLTPSSDTGNVIQPTGDYKNLVLKTVAGQAKNPLSITDENDVLKAYITTAGGGYYAGNVGVGITPLTRLHIVGNSADDVITTDAGLNFSTVTAPASGSLTLALVEEEGNLGVGAYRYAITYVTKIGETNAVSSTAITTETGKTKVNITLPVSTDYRVTGRKIYRTVVDGSQFSLRLLATINNNTDTEYVDNIADASLGATSTNVYYRNNTTNRIITINGVASMSIGGVTTLGAGAGQAVTSGGRSVYIGRSAGMQATTGNDQTLVGYLSGYALTTGNGNTALGSYSLFAATTTNRCVAVGTYAGFASKGDDNTYVGYQSGKAQTTGARNTLVGMDVMVSGSDRAASNNTVVGYRAGYNLTGNGNVFLGYQAGYNETGSNKLYISNSNTATPLILGDFSAQTLTINGALNSTGAFTSSNFRLSDLNTAPASASATGVKGDIRITADSIYVCIDTDTWVKAALATF